MKEVGQPLIGILKKTSMPSHSVNHMVEICIMDVVINALCTPGATTNHISCDMVLWREGIYVYAILVHGNICFI